MANVGLALKCAFLPGRLALAHVSKVAKTVSNELLKVFAASTATGASAEDDVPQLGHLVTS